MNSSLCLLAASWLASAGGNPAPMPIGPAETVSGPIVVSTPQQSYTTGSPVYYQPARQEDPGFFGRVRSKIGDLFGKKPAQGSTCPCQNQQGTPVPVHLAEPPLADLQQTTYPQVPLTQPPLASGEEESTAEPKEGKEINQKYMQKVGHEDDYSWVTGQLYKTHGGGNAFWVVRYATVDTEDKFGGSIVLAPAVNMKNFREGDLVSVKGEVLNEGRASKYHGGPLYRVTSIDMIDRAD